MGVTAGIMALICPWVFRLLTPDESVRALATQVLRIALLAEPLYGVSIVAAGALRGTGDTFVPSIMNLCSIWIVRLGACARARAAAGTARHVDRYGDRAMRARTSDALPAAYNEIL